MGDSKQDIEFQRRIALAVRLLRVKAGLSQVELAKRIGLTSPAICQTEYIGTDHIMRRSNLKTLKKIADALDITLWRLIRMAETGTHVVTHDHE